MSIWETKYLTGMVELYQKAGILHRDISCDNLMAERTSDGSWHGILNDFDLAIRNNAPDHYSLERTGTLPFMAFDLLRNSAQPHLFRHDAESLFYVLVWIAVHYDEQGCFVQPKVLDNWMVTDCKTMMSSKSAFWNNPLETLKLTNFYEGLRLWITLLSVPFIEFQKTLVNEENQEALNEFKSDVAQEFNVHWVWLDAMIEKQQPMSDEKLIGVIKLCFTR
jgi:serine/threonine protein kinase